MTSTHTILVIEDHPTLRSMLVNLFSANGFVVTEAINGREGLEKALLGGFSAIIMDLKMPQMDGMTFLNAYQQNPPQTKNGPIIVYSNFAYSYAKDEVLRRGASAFVPKDTVSTQELLAEVNRLIAEKPLPTQ